MKKVIIIFGILCLTVITSAQQTQYGDNTKILIDKNMLTPEQIASASASNKVSEVGKWVGLGKEIGTAMDAGLTAVTSHAEQLADTKVGKFTMFLIAYKVIGKDIIQFIVGVPITIAWLWYWCIIYKRKCVPRQIISKRYENGKPAEYQMYDPRPSPESSFGHASMVGLGIVLGVIIIFV